LSFQIVLFQPSSWLLVLLRMVLISYHRCHRYSLVDNQIHSHRLYSVTLLPTHHTYYKIIPAIIHHYVCVSCASIAFAILAFVGKKIKNSLNHVV